MIRLQVYAEHLDQWVTVLITDDPAVAERDRQSRALFAMIVMPMRIVE